MTGIGMNTQIIAINSQTIGMKAKTLLRKNGIRSEITKIDPQIQTGCQYALVIDAEDYFLAISVLQRNGISYKVL